jgi:predicted RNase H-like nuclease (RuvC/YqgF family)
MISPSFHLPVIFDFKQKMAAMEEKMEKQEIRISSLEDQLKIQHIEIRDLKSKMLKFGLSSNSS